MSHRLLITLEKKAKPGQFSSFSSFVFNKQAGRRAILGAFLLQRRLWTLGFTGGQIA